MAHASKFTDEQKLQIALDLLGGKLSHAEVCRKYDISSTYAYKLRWTYSDSRLRVLNNFRRDFTGILRAAGIEVGTFHDLRRTCLSGWLTNGLAEYDVMQLAGHSDFSTTHRFYLAVRTDLVDRARTAALTAMGGNSGARLARAPISR